MRKENDRGIAVSVIVPVYNAQSYLTECLGNLVNQTLQNVEIILVNDASTDGSLAIMRECERQYPQKVVVIDSKVNLGAGGARNLGIERAAGEYIGFVDSDDLVEVTMYEKLYRRAKEGNYAVVDCGYYKQSEDLAIVQVSDDIAGILDTDKRKNLIVSGGYIVSKIFHRDLFQDPQLCFRRNAILEDADFLTYLYATIENIGNVKELLYYYRDNKESLSHVNNPEKYYRNIYEAMSAIHKKLAGLDDYVEIQDAVEYELLQMYSYGVNVCLKAYLDHEDDKWLEHLEGIASLKREFVHGDYNNPYVINKIHALDIAIMQLNDRSSEELLRWGKMQVGEKGK